MRQTRSPRVSKWIVRGVAVLILLAALAMVVFGHALFFKARAQTVECWPEMQAVGDSMRDLKAVRAAEEEQVKLLKQVLVELRKRPSK